jgi:hypothetical protein
MTEADGGTLSVTLPPRWQRFHFDRLLAQMETEAAMPELQEELGEPVARWLSDMLEGVQSTYTQGDVILAAMRVRADDYAIDMMTLALPTAGEAEDRATQLESSSTGGEETAYVNIGNGHGVAHRSSPAGDRSEVKFFPAYVQLVTRIPPSDRGAIMTLMSSAKGAEDLLERDAEQIAESLRLPA